MRIFALLLFLVGILKNHGATYYVDWATGSDAANGTSTGTPWKHHPGDDYATGTADGTALAAGDIVKLKGGVTYYATNGIFLTTSGTAASPITLDGNSAGDWGTGKAVVDALYRTNVAVIQFNAGISHHIVRHLELKNAGGYAEDHPIVLAAANGDYGNGEDAWSTPVYGVGVEMSYGNNTNVYLSDLYIHHIGIWYHTLGWDGYAVSGDGIRAVSPQSLTITNVELTKCGGTCVGIYAAASISGVLVTDSYFHDDCPSWAMDIAPQASGVTLTNIVIRKNRFINLSSRWTGTEDDPPTTTAPHHNYIFVRGNGVLSYWFVTIERNLFMETNHVQIGLGGTAAIHANNGVSFNLWNNVFIRPWSYNGMVFLNSEPFTGMTQVCRIYNNTMLRETGGYLLVTGSGQGRRHVHIQNNLITDWTNMLANSVRINADANATPTNLNHNLYWHPSYGTSQVYIATLADYPGSKLFPEMKSIGFESNGLYADPLFIDCTNANVTLRDLSLLAGSPAIGAGTNLSAFFTEDYAGNQRSVPWDMGAYEYVQPGPDLTFIPGAPKLRGIRLVQ